MAAKKKSISAMKGTNVSPGDTKKKDIKYLGIPEPKKDNAKQLGPRHPCNDRQNNELLVKFIKERMDFANLQRSQEIQQYVAIDTEVSGFIAYDKADQQRDRDNKAGKGVKPTTMNLELTKTQLDESVTYLMNVFAPSSGMFEAKASPDKQAFANGFALKLNQDGERKQYYRQYAKGFLDALKYNLGGWFVSWEQETGTTMGNTADRGKASLVKNQVVWEGNNIEAIDPYNIFWDRSVHPCNVPEYGEFFAMVDVHREFRVRKMESDGKIFNISRFINNTAGTNVRYYQVKPTVRMDLNTDQKTGRSTTDWVSWFAAGSGTRVQSGIETIVYFGWLVPADFGLSDSEDLEIWKIIVMADGYVVAAEKQQNGHGLLPIALVAPIEDGLGNQTKSYAETLIPVGRFASHLLNVHIQGSRKSLFGVTFYDPTVIPFGEFPEEVAPKVPVKPRGYGKPIGESIYQVFDGPKTDNTMNDLKSTMDLMQKLLPTDMAKQVANLDRATQYQAAATVQGTDRRSQKIARMIEDMGMKKVRLQVMYNMLQFPLSIEYVDPQTGQRQKVSTADLRDADIEYTLSEGLKGIDKLQLIEGIKEVLGMIVQNAGAMQEIDLVKYINYWTELMGDKTDFTQFRKTNAFSQLDPQIQGAVLQLLQSGQLNGMIQQMQAAQQENSLKKTTGAQLPMPQGSASAQADPNDPNAQSGDVGGDLNAQMGGNGAGQMPIPSGGQIPPGLMGQ